MSLSSSGFLETRALHVMPESLRDARMLEGRQIGAYLIGALIDAGGMGVVYRARDTKLARDVALKVLPDLGPAEGNRRARFAREARLLAALNHQNIAAIYSIEEDADLCALVLELVEGETLSDRLAAGPPSIDEALAIAAQIARALEAAHDKGIVHRDLKPANVRITTGGAVKLLDFGLAKAIELGPEAAEATTRADAETRDGVVLGTFPYMSPEQARGNPTDKRTDIWAFGCVLYELLSGRPAFKGATRSDTVAAILHRDPNWRALPERTPAVVDRLLRRCLKKDSAERLPDIGEARIELERLEHRRAPTRKWWIVAAASAGIATIAAAGWLMFGEGREAATLTGSPRQLTFAPGWEGEPALSPDGTLVAYTSDESGNADIWIVDARGGNALRLTSADTPEHHPAWFPDGSALAFVAGREGRESIWKVPRLGGSPTVLVSDGTDPAISPDGSQIAFVRPGPSGLHRIVVAPIADTSRARVLTGDDNGLWNHQSPAWSPDGRVISYAAQNGLWLVRADGSKAWPLTTDRDQEPVWSADGRSIYFTSIRGGAAALWRVAVQGGPPIRMTFGTGPERQPTTSSDGARLAYSTYATTSDIVLVDLRKGKQHQLTGVTEESKPTFSPDRRAVVFTSNRWDGRFTLWLQPLTDGAPDGAPRRLTDHPGTANYPVFSPDGRWLAYGRVLDDRRDIWVMSAAAELPTRITQGGGVHFHPSWSPDGLRVAFVSEESGNYRIEQVSVTNGRPAGAPRAVASMRSMPMSPVWSADGSEIAYVMNSEIWMTAADGSGASRQVTSGADVERLRWNRVTGRLYASGLWNANEVSVRLVDPRSGESRPLPFPLRLGSTRTYVDFDVALDETLAAIDREDLKGDIWVLDSRPHSY